jgi:hypothetical protein
LGIRLQVFFVILTGVVVIVITTAVVIGMGRAPSNADGLDGSSDPFPTLTLPRIPSRQPTPAGSASPTPESSPTKKPPVKPPSPTPPANKLSISCESNTLATGADMNCTVGLDMAASSNMVVTLDASTAFVTIPGTVTILAGGYFSDPFLMHGNERGGPTTVTAKVSGLTAQFSVTVS